MAEDDIVRRDIPRSASVAAAAVVLYVLPFLQNVRDGFVSDDWVMLRALTGKAVREVITGRELGGPPFWRPFAATVNLMETRCFGLNPLGYHLVSLAVGGAAVLLLFLLVRRVFGLRAASITALAFSSLPPHAGNVVWVSGRPEALAAVCLFAALLSHRRWRESAFFLWRVLSLALLLLGLLAKEVLIIAPLLALLYDRVTDEPGPWRGSLTRVAPWAMVVGGYLAVRTFVLGGVGGYGATHLQTGFYAVRNLFRYAQIFFLPVGVESAMPWVMNHQWAAFVPVTLAVGAGVAFGWRLLTRPMALAGIAGALLALLPVANLFPFPWRLYFASVWFSLFLAGVSTALLDSANRSLRTLCCVALALWLAACVAGKTMTCRTWHEASEIAQTMIGDLAEGDFPTEIPGQALVLAGPDTLRGAQVMGVGLREALSILRPEIKADVRNLFLFGMSSPGATGLFFRDEGSGVFVLGQRSDSVYDYLMPPDYNCDKHPGETRRLDGLSYTVLAQRFRPYLSEVAIHVDPAVYSRPHTFVYHYQAGRLRKLSPRPEAGGQLMAAAE